MVKTSPQRWHELSERHSFKALLRAKALFIAPATAFFLVYYFALPLGVALVPDLMKTKVGPVNIAYVFALSQFIMTWTVAALYLRAAATFDDQAQALLEDIGVLPDPAKPKAAKKPKGGRS